VVKDKKIQDPKGSPNWSTYRSGALNWMSEIFSCYWC